MKTSLFCCCVSWWQRLCVWLLSINCTYRFAGANRRHTHTQTHTWILLPYHSFHRHSQQSCACLCSSSAFLFLVLLLWTERSPSPRPFRHWPPFHYSNKQQLSFFLTCWRGYNFIFNFFKPTDQLCNITGRKSGNRRRFHFRYLILWCV